MIDKEFDPINGIILNRIKEIMVAKGISKEQLSEETGIKLNTLKGYLNSGNKITIKKLIKIAHALDVCVSYLISETEIENINTINEIFNCIKKIQSTL